MPDPAFDRLLDEIAAAHQRGEPLSKLFKMAETFLSGQPKGYRGGKRDQMLAELKQLSSMAPVIESTVRAMGENQGPVAIRRVFEKLRPFDAADAAARLAEIEQQASAAGAGHRKARLARGLSASAGTGKPGPRSIFYQPPEEPVQINLKGRKSGDITLAEYNAAKAVRDKRIFDEMPLGASRIGGLPDLPPGVAWPRYKGKLLPFVAQIDLSAFPATDGLLPPDGWLYAFALVSNEEEHYPPPHAVFVHRGKRDALVRAQAPKVTDFWPDWGEESLYELVPVLAALPPRKRPKRKSDEDDEEGERTAGWLLGEIDDAFCTAGEAADREFRDGDDWINLLAVESVGSMQWSDCGHLYFLIRRSDLSNGNLSNILAAVESS